MNDGALKANTSDEIDAIAMRHKYDKTILLRVLGGGTLLHRSSYRSTAIQTIIDR